jgi:hypothetical protein
LVKLPPNPRQALMLWALTPLLVSCAAPAVRPSAPVAQTATPQGTIISGVLVAIRPVSANTTLSSGSADVLAALRLAAPAQAPNATEFVIQRSDGDVTTVVLPAPASNPGASMSASNFSVGDQVELLTGEQTELIHRNQ